MYISPQAAPYAPCYPTAPAPQSMCYAPPPAPYVAPAGAPPGPAAALAAPSAVPLRSDPLERVNELLLRREYPRAWNIMNDLATRQGTANFLALRGAIGRLFDHPSAASDFNRALALDPGNTFAVLNRAVLQLQDPSTAAYGRADIDTVVANDPNNDFALYCQGVHAYLYGGEGEALCIFQKLVDLNPNHASAHAALADCYGSTKDAAVREACAALALDPSQPVAHFVLNFWNYPGKAYKYKKLGRTSDHNVADPATALARLPVFTES